MKHVEVVAAVILDNNRVFGAQRKDFGETARKWEFPGGKIEAGETHQQALIREIREELGVDIAVGDLIITVEHQYTTFSITMHAYKASVVAGEILLSEHLDSRWLAADELFSVDWAAADVPIVEKVNGIIS